MALNAKTAKGGTGGNDNRVEQLPVEPGTYPARVVQIVDLGLQEQRPYKGEQKPPAHMIMLTYELVDEFLKDENGEDVEDKPRWISEEFPLYNLKAERAKSTKRYYALDPQETFEGDFSLLIGAAGNVMVTSYVVKSGKNEGKERNKVQDVAAMRPKDIERTPELQNEGKMFSLDEPNLEIFGSLPEWLQEKIKGNLEYAGSPLEAALGGKQGKDTPKEEKAPEEAPEKPKKAPKKEESAPEEPDLDEEEGEVPW